MAAGHDYNSRPEKCTVFVRSLEATVEERDLLRVFSRCGEIAGCKVVKEQSESGEWLSQGFGFVDFTDEEGARRALRELDSIEIHGRYIQVRPRMGGRSRGGGGGRGSATAGRGRGRGRGRRQSYGDEPHRPMQSAQPMADCYYYLKGSCRHGERCKYRHSSEARENAVVCRAWSEGRCNDPLCSMRHPSSMEKKIGSPSHSSTKFDSEDSGQLFSAGDEEVISIDGFATEDNSPAFSEQQCVPPTSEVDIPQCNVLIAKIKPFQNEKALDLKFSSIKESSQVLGSHSILWHSLLELHVLLKVNLEETAIAKREEMIRTLLVKRALKPKMAQHFYDLCVKSLKEECSRNGLPWEVTLCQCSQNEERRMTTRSRLIQCLQSFTTLWALWSDFKKRYGEVSERTLYETCSDVIHILKEPNDQIVVFSDLNPLAKLDVRRAREECFGERILKLLGTCHGRRARLLDIPRLYWEKHGPLPLTSENEGVALQTFLSSVPSITSEGTRATDTFFTANSGQVTVPISVPYRQQQSQRSTYEKETFHDGISHTPGQVKIKYHERSKEPLKLSDIQPPLERRNYRSKFHNLLFWEENEHMVILKERCSGQYKFVLHESDYKPGPQGCRSHIHSSRLGYLLGITGDQIAYATQASEGVTLAIEQGTRISSSTGDSLIQQEVKVKAEIMKEKFSHTEDKLYLALDVENVRILERNAIVHREQCDIAVRVEFELKHSYFDGLHKSIDKLPDQVIKRILPGHSDFLHPQNPFINTALTERCTDDQALALQAMLAAPARGPPFLVSGPFGTGKTYLLAMAVHCFFDQGRRSRQPVRVFVGTQQHVSARNFLECFAEKMLIQHGDVLTIRLTPEKFYEKNTNPDLESLTKTVSQFKNASNQVKRQQLCLVVSTCGTSMQLSWLLPSGYFTHILLDEGSHLREPEGVIPLQLASPDTKIVIAGDQHQVGPALLVLGNEAHSNGLSVSLLERLHKLYTNLGDSSRGNHTMLVTNHRCHSSILRLVQKLFYHLPLHCNVRDGSAHPDAVFPLKFVCSGVSDAACSVESATNEQEAKIVLSEAQTFCTKWPEDTWGKRDFTQVCAISATRSQVTVFSKLLGQRHHSEFHERMKDIHRLPTYDIQGREYRAIFISTSEPTKVMPNGMVVPTNPTKSISDRFVFNTVVTRSRALVVAVGNPFLLLRMEKHMVQRYGEMGKCWSHYLDACLSNGTVTLHPSVSAPQGYLDKLKERVQQSLKLVLR